MELFYKKIFPKGKTKYLVILVAMILLLSGPLFLNRYMLITLFLLLEYMILAESYDLFSGYVGEMNLGHACFFGISAYTFGILTANFDMGILISIVLAIIITVAFAYGMGKVILHLSGAYFAIVSLAFLVLLRYVTINLKELTGGVAGLSHVFGDTLFTSYYAASILAIVCVFAHFVISRSYHGLVLDAIKIDEEVTGSFGPDTHSHKIRQFSFSSIFAALAGITYFYNMSYIYPGFVFGFGFALTPVVMALLGGSGLWLGPLVGALILYTVEELVFTQIPYFSLLLYGLVMVLIGLFLPKGIIRSFGPFSST